MGALEPYVRRHWPRTLVSWSLALQGRLREPVVGRDILFGLALGLCWVLIDDVENFFAPGLDGLSLTPAMALRGVRAGLRDLLLGVPTSIRGTLIFFFALFLFRVLLRNVLLAGIAFTLLFSAPGVIQNPTALHAAVAGLTYGLAALAVVRFGLVPLSVAIFIDGFLLHGSPGSLDPSSWYFPQALWPLVALVTLSAWAPLHLGRRKPRLLPRVAGRLRPPHNAGSPQRCPKTNSATSFRDRGPFCRSSKCGGSSSGSPIPPIAIAATGS